MSHSKPMIGNADELDLDRARYLWTMQRTTLVVFAITALWVALAAVVQNLLMFLIAGFVGVSSLVCYGLTSRGHDLLGRMIWFAIGLIAIVAATQLTAPSGNTEILFMALLGGPFLTFSLERESKYIWSLVAVIAVTWVTFRIVGPGQFGPYMVDEDLARNVVSYASPATAFAIICVEMYFFSVITIGYNKRLQQSNLKAQQASRAKSEFLATMSHEIRTPMNGVIGMVEILGASDLTQAQHRILATIRDSSFSLLQIIEDILDMSRIEAGKMQLSHQPMETLPLIESVMDSLRSYADAHNVTLCMRVDPDLPRVMTVDAGRLRQIMVNLLGNAIKFSRRPAGETPGKAFLHVSVLPDNRLCLTIADDGIGIDPEFQARLFTPFQQSEAVTTRRFGGSGLGLAIVHQLLTLMGGQISVHSAPNEGATFTVILPIVDGSGRVDRPNLSQRRVILSLPCTNQTNILRVYAESCGARVEVMPLHEVCALAKTATDDPIFVIPSEKDLQTLSEVPADVIACFTNRRVIQVTGLRTASQGLVGRSTYVILINPILPSDFWAALRTMNAIDAKVSLLQGAAVPQPASDRTLPHPVQMRILVAEDNEINQMVISRQLAQLGHEAVIAANGREALQILRDQRFDLLLTDCHMPEMDGFALTLAIRKDEAEKGKPYLPIIAITANALSGEVETCLAHGMDGYLSKPLRLADLSAQVLTVMENHSREMRKAR